jgi:hypothetical protein
MGLEMVFNSDDLGNWGLLRPRPRIDELPPWPMWLPAPFPPCPHGLPVIAGLAQAQGAMGGRWGPAIGVLAVIEVGCPGLNRGPAHAGDWEHSGMPEKNPENLLDCVKPLVIMRP